MKSWQQCNNSRRARRRHLGLALSSNPTVSREERCASQMYSHETLEGLYTFDFCLCGFERRRRRRRNALPVSPWQSKDQETLRRRKKKKKKLFLTRKKNEIFDLTSAKNVQVFCRFDSFFLVLMPLHVTR